ncbi:MAG: hypothetical protein MRJ93_11240 [Nitrososphaeraceae archaeon]|nr:hypothetical protein [Nitrososphaeraceae archaeon]
MNNNKTKIGSMFLLAAILVVGTISVTNIPKSFAAPGADIQTIKCVNSNVNINGIDVIKRHQTTDLEEVGAAEQQEQGQQQIQNGQRNGLFDGLNIDKNLVNICVNFNFNEQEDDEDDSGGGQA